MLKTAKDEKRNSVKNSNKITPFEQLNAIYITIPHITDLIKTQVKKSKSQSFQVLVELIGVSYTPIIVQTGNQRQGLLVKSLVIQIFDFSNNTRPFRYKGLPEDNTHLIIQKQIVVDRADCQRIIKPLHQTR